MFHILMNNYDLINSSTFRIALSPREFAAPHDRHTSHYDIMCHINCRRPIIDYRVSISDNGIEIIRCY